MQCFSSIWSPSVSHTIFCVFLNGGDIEFLVEVTGHFFGFDSVVLKDLLNGIVKLCVLGTR
jgi:hypothetical protein